MPWGAEYQTPDEIAEQRAQQDATLEAQQRAKLSQFERRVVDALTDIAGSLKKIADNTAPLYELDAQSGEVKVHPAVVTAAAIAVGDQLRTVLFGEANTAAGDGGGVSAGPVSPPPGPARPEDHCGRYSSQEHCGQLHEDEVGGLHECYEASDEHRHRCLCGLTWPADTDPENPS